MQASGSDRSRAIPRLASAAILVGICGATTPLKAAAADPVKTMQDLARDLDLQTKMPTDIPEPEFHWSPVLWHIPSGVAQWVLWGALAVGLGFALFALRGSLPGLTHRARPRADGAVVLPTDATVARMTETGEDADELARKGRFAEAIHLLLLRSLAELRRGLGIAIADSLTSREILHRLALPDLGRRALADLIQRVEHVHFGRQVAAATDYSACRSSFDALVDALRAPGAGARP